MAKLPIIGDVGSGNTVKAASHYSVFKELRFFYSKFYIIS